MAILTGIDVLGVQRYVFASNRLRDAVAASWLVHWATAADGALAGTGGEVLLAGGGNAVLRFPDEARAREFVARLTRRLYDEAPGLEIAVAHRAQEADGLAPALEHLHQVDLPRAKLDRVPSVPQLGLSVTAACRITGLPATGVDPQDRAVPLSRMVLRWRDQGVRERATGRWESFLAGDARFAFPPEVNDMGRTRGDTSLVGVVHVDGNGIGQMITAWLHRCVKESRSDARVRDELHAWSTALDGVGCRSLERVVGKVTAAIKEGRITGALPKLRFDLGHSGDRVLLPVRPVLLGGDDLTFLCDGRIALDLAATALHGFSGEIEHLGRVTACAGVALVPAHAPFERAYELAEALCTHAKRRRREQNDNGAWIDWHIGTLRPGEGIDRIRARAYTHRASGTSYELTCRPYRLGTDAAERETWRWLSQTVLGTGDDGFRGESWSQHRNKLKELASLVREGPDGVRRAREGWTEAAGLAWPGGLEQTGGFFDARRTPLLDAIELLDVHLPLGKEATS